MGMHVILVGNPVDGVTVLGPFDTQDDALLYAEDFLRDEDFWVAPLHASLADAS